jgi:hypothetical protein
MHITKVETLCLFAQYDYPKYMIANSDIGCWSYCEIMQE